MTLDRYPRCLQSLSVNLASSGLDTDEYEILWADNGSRDRRVIDEIHDVTSRITYARVNTFNEGVAKTLNQLMIRAKGEHIVQLGNDYLMPSGWLKNMVWHAEHVPNTGMVGISWQRRKPNILNVFSHVMGVGSVAIDLRDFDSPIFGVKLKTRALIEACGAFDETFHPYGFEDSDYHHRSVLAGFRNYYIPGMYSKHLGDEGPDPLRSMKDRALRELEPYYLKKRAKYDEHGTFVPWPDMKGIRFDAHQ